MGLVEEEAGTFALDQEVDRTRRRNPTVKQCQSDHLELAAAEFRPPIKVCPKMVGDPEKKIVSLLFLFNKAKGVKKGVHKFYYMKRQVNSLRMNLLGSLTKRGGL